VDALLHAFSTNDNTDCLLSGDSATVHTKATSMLDLGAFLDPPFSPFGVVPASPPMRGSNKNEEMMVEPFLDFDDVESTLKLIQADTAGDFAINNEMMLMNNNTFDNNCWADNFADLFQIQA